MSVAYIPFACAAPSVEAGWLAEVLACRVEVVQQRSSLNLSDNGRLPALSEVRSECAVLAPHAWVVAEGIGGFLWCAVAREAGFGGAFTVLPYVNPSSWFDVAALNVYCRYADGRDRIFVGSTPSACVYRSRDIAAVVGEPFGIDCDTFFPRQDAGAVVASLGLTANCPMLLFAGRVEPDKDFYRLLSVALKARLLFPELQVVVATHVIDRDYFALVSRLFAQEPNLHLVVEPTRDQLAALYSAADVFATASTSHFETFGRAPAEALACGTSAVAPCYDGFAEALAQPGGHLVDVEFENGVPRVAEAALLRAIYQVLSAPAAHSADEIATIARQRFCRSRTLPLLSYLTDGDASSESKNLGCDSVDIDVPPEWGVALKRMDDMTPANALAHLWDTRAHRELGTQNASFQSAVRTALTRTASHLSESGRAACH